MCTMSSSRRMRLHRRRNLRWPRRRRMPINTPPAEDYLRILPEIIMTIAGTLIMILQVLLPEEKPKSSLGHLSLIAFLAALVGALYSSNFQGTGFSGMIVIDGYATFFRLLVIGVGILSVLSAYQYLSRE